MDACCEIALRWMLHNITNEKSTLGQVMHWCCQTTSHYLNKSWPRPHFYQTRSAWSMDQGSNKNHSPVNNCAPTVTKFCVMWEGQALPHDTKFSNCRDKIVDSRAFLSWSLIHGSSWSGLIKLGPDLCHLIVSQWVRRYNQISGLARCFSKFLLLHHSWLNPGSASQGSCWAETSCSWPF